MFFGLLRGNEILRIRNLWVNFEEIFICVKFREDTKTWKGGFAYFVPNEFKKTSPNTWIKSMKKVATPRKIFCRDIRKKQSKGGEEH